MRFFVLLVGFLISWNCHAGAPKINSAKNKTPVSACKHHSDPINEEKFVSANGIEHWVTIKGSRCDNPVILFLHGGPANPMSPFSEAIYGTWKKEFTLVQWDQRGSGKTYIRNPAVADSPLSIELMAHDGVAIAEHLRQYLHQSKVILMGSSWGSALGLQMVKTHPELFSAYIGTAQLVAQHSNQAASYTQTLNRARAEGQTEIVESLEKIGSPPWDNPRHFGVLRRATKVLEARRTTPAPKTWWLPAPSYQMERMEAQYEAAEEYSFIQFVGMKNDGMYSQLDFHAKGYDFALPVFFVQGEEDLVTVPDVSKAYFEQIQVPQKAYFLVAKTGHNPNPLSVAMEYKVLKEHVLPLLKH